MISHCHFNIGNTKAAHVSLLVTVLASEFNCANFCRKNNDPDKSHDEAFGDNNLGVLSAERSSRTTPWFVFLPERGQALRLQHLSLPFIIRASFAGEGTNVTN